jgi:hypothetical protein
MSAPRDEFYVGYLPTPARIARISLGAVTAALLWLSILAALLTSRQDNPGYGVWEIEVSEFTGWINLDPAPSVDFGDDTILVVDFNKFGAGPRLEGRAFATLSGTVIERDGVRLLELLPGDDAIADAPSEDATAAQGIWRTAGVQTLFGEITDPKCYLGAMKPGTGLTHRGCAALCISGGIPPLFVVERGDNLPARMLVLVDSNGAPIVGDSLARLLTFVGERGVRISGEVWRKPNAPFEALRVDTASITRN